MGRTTVANIIHKGGKMVLKNNTARIMVGFVVGILLFTVSSASAATIIVDDSGGADYLSIQAAINNASAGDTIEVQSGTYLENVVVNKTLSLKGVGIPLVNASGSGTAITITAGGSTVDGFNVTGSGTEWNGGDADSGIKIKSDNNRVLNSTVGFNNYGVYVFESEMNSIENNSVYSNTEGIYVFYSSNNSIVENNVTLNTNHGLLVSNSNNCTISNNTALENDDGIYLTASTNCSISDNNADSNLNGIYLYSYSCNNTLTRNTATGNNYGIYLNSFSSNNTLIGNNATNNSDRGIYLYSYSSNNLLTDNNASGSYFGIILHVNSGNNILVSNNALNNYDGITLYSSNGNTLTGNNATGNSGRGIYLVSSSNSNTLDGNTASDSYHGIYLGNSESNTLTGNSATGSSQNGIYLQNSNSNTLTGNTVLGNSNSGIYLYGSSSNILTSNNASENTGYGYNFYSSSSNMLVKNNALNNGYGFYVVTASGFNILHENNLIGNTNYNAHDTVGSNTWSYNHYSDYTGSDSDGGGIGDTAYYIAGDVGAKDMAPAMQPWNMSENSGLGAYFTLYSDNNITLYEGYSLTLQQIDVDGNKAWFTFEKDGTQVDSIVKSAGESFSYTTTIDGTNYLIFQGVLDTVFRGVETELIKITYFYQFSEINGSILIDNSNDLPNPVPSITLSSPSSSSVSNTEGDSTTFTATVDQVSNVTWILDGVTIQTNISIQTASYYNTSAKTGTHNLTVFAENANGTDHKQWTWTVTEPSAPSIILSSPSSSSVSDVEDNSRTFTATVDQVADVTWILDGVTLYTNTSVQTASYYNSSAKTGIHNLTVFTENTNGVDQKKWTWSVRVSMPSVYDGSITEGDGYQINNYVIDVTDVFVSANTAVFKVYDKGTLKHDAMLGINESFSFDFEGSTVQLKLRSIADGVLSRASVLIETNYSISDLHTNGIVSGGHEYATYIDNTYTMQLQKGWNLVSTPLTPDTPDVNTLFDSNSNVILPIYSWNTANKQYYDVSTIEISKGYWILALNDTQVTFAGTPYSG